MLRIWLSPNRGSRHWTVVAGLLLTLAACTGHGAHPAHPPSEADALVASFQSISAEEKTGGFRVLQRGSGPGVLILHELPGLTVECMQLANRVAEAGYTVYVPVLFGSPGKAQSFRNVFRACFGGGFHCFSGSDPGPVLARLRVLANYIRGQRGDRIGVIGLCLTGILPVALMANPGVAAPVLSEPALPFAWTDHGKSALGVSRPDLDGAKARGVPILAFRFNNDDLSPGQRSRALRREFGRQIEIVEIDSSPDNLHGFSSKAHAVLTVEFADYPGDPTRAALDKILAFFDRQLR